MKINGVAVPLAIAGLAFAAVWAIGMLAIRSSTLATESSVRLLRLHMEVVRLHDALLERSGGATTERVDELGRAIDQEIAKDSELRIERWPESWVSARENERPAPPQLPEFSGSGETK